MTRGHIPSENPRCRAKFVPYPDYPVGPGVPAWEESLTPYGGVGLDPDLDPGGPQPYDQRPGYVDPEQARLERRIRGQRGVQLVAQMPNLQQYLRWMEPGGVLSNATTLQMQQAAVAQGLNPDAFLTLHALMYDEGVDWFEGEVPQVGDLVSVGRVEMAPIAKAGVVGLTLGAGLLTILLIKAL